MRILTYNIRHGTDFLGRARLAQQGAVIKASGADVVFLQEVDRGTRRCGQVDLAAQLAALCGLPHLAFGANHRRDDGEFGNAILSRWPLTEVANHALPQPQPRRYAHRFSKYLLEGRGILEAVVDYQGTPVRLLCAHFGLLPDEPMLAARAATALIDADSGPLIFGGDLNRPGAFAPCHRLLASQLADCARLTARAPLATFPSPWPRVRLDYLYTRALQTRHVSVLPTMASDHRPLLAEVRLN